VFQRLTSSNEILVEIFCVQCSDKDSSRTLTPKAIRGGDRGAFSGSGGDDHDGSGGSGGEDRYDSGDSGGDDRDGSNSGCEDRDGA
jgi:hypothetical protein